MSQKITNGNVTIRVGSEDPITLALLEDDGITPIDLTGTINHTVRMKNKKTNDSKVIPTDRVNILGIKTLGKIQITQTASDFDAAAIYEYYVTFTDAGGKARIIPEDKNCVWSVIAAI